MAFQTDDGEGLAGRLALTSQGGAVVSSGCRRASAPGPGAGEPLRLALPMLRRTLRKDLSVSVSEPLAEAERVRGSASSSEELESTRP